MSGSNFAFLLTEWPAVYEAAVKAANAAHPDRSAIHNGSQNCLFKYCSLK